MFAEGAAGYGQGMSAGPSARTPERSALRRLTSETPDSAICRKGVRPWQSAQDTPSSSSASRLARSSCEPD